MIVNKTYFCIIFATIFIVITFFIAIMSGCEFSSITNAYDNQNLSTDATIENTNDNMNSESSVSSESSGSTDDANKDEYVSTVIKNKVEGYRGHTAESQ